MCELKICLITKKCSISVADLPGLIPDSHKNKGLGVTFLKHAERCKALLFIIDMSLNEPWTHLDILKYEISQFNPQLINRPMIVIANKMDLSAAKVLFFQSQFIRILRY